MPRLVPNEKVAELDGQTAKPRAARLVAQSVEVIWRDRCVALEQSLATARSEHAEDLRQVLAALDIKPRRKGTLQELREQVSEWRAKSR